MNPTPWWTNYLVADATGWALVAIGMCVLAWALLGDRSKGRKRCPRCWYDMQGTPATAGGHLCPECGHLARNGKQLLRTRRSRRVIACAMAFLVAGYLAFAIPQVMISGRTGWVPTTALVLALPWMDSTSDQTKPPLASGRAVSTGEVLFKELRTNRFDRKRMDGWQLWLLWEMVLSGNPDAVGARETLVNRYVGYMALFQHGNYLTARQYRRFWDWEMASHCQVLSLATDKHPAVVRVWASADWADGSAGRVLRVRPVGHGTSAHVCSAGPAWWAEATKRDGWADHVCTVDSSLPVERVLVDLELAEISKDDFDRGSRVGRVIWTKRVALTLPAQSRARGSTGSRPERPIVRGDGSLAIHPSEFFGDEFFP